MVFRSSNHRFPFWILDIGNLPFTNTVFGKPTNHPSGLQWCPIRAPGWYAVTQKPESGIVKLSSILRNFGNPDIGK
jgi:hypothetical protein